MPNEFLNPYNFIPLPKEKANAYTDEDRHTGVIEFSITTKSPLFIPNSSSKAAFKSDVEGHGSFDFYSYTELDGGKTYENEYHEPVIPGSEIRGMVRSIYETLTDSCMGVLNANTYPVMRINEMYKAGLIKREKDNESYKFTLFKADMLSYGNYPDHEYAEGELVYFKEEFSENKGRKASECSKEYIQGYKKGYFIKGNISESKKRNHIFELKKEPVKVKEEPVRVKKEDFDNLFAVLDSYKDNVRCDFRKEVLSILESGKEEEQCTLKKENVKKLVSILKNCKDNKQCALEKKDLESLLSVLESAEGKEQCILKKEVLNQLDLQCQYRYAEYEYNLRKFLDGKGDDCFPVFYSMLGEDLLYLSPACMTKEISKNSVKDLAGDMVPCGTESSKGKCPTCDLFGMIGSNNEEADASKIRFADARVENISECKDYYDTIVTLEALGTPKLGNVEFYLQKPEGADFWNYDYYTKGGKVIPYKATLRGRKFYWHQPEKKLENNVEKTILNKTIRPVKTEKVFYGKMFFDGISNKQIKQLLWILSCGEQEDIGYKLGAGKPLGLGSVKLKVEKISTRSIKVEEDTIKYVIDGVENPTIPSYEEAGFSGEVKEAFFKIASLKATEGITVTYPIVDSQIDQTLNEGFKWFVENHSGFDHKKNKETKMPRNRGQMRRIHALPEITDDKITLPILEENSGNKKSNYNGNKKSNNAYKKIDYNSDVPKKWDEITCSLTYDAKEDTRNGEGFVGAFSYNNMSGTVFGLKEKLSKGTKIKVKINNIKESNRGIMLFGDYVQ